MIWRLTLNITMVLTLFLVGCTSRGSEAGRAKAADSVGEAQKQPPVAGHEDPDAASSLQDPKQTRAQAAQQLVPVAAQRHPFPNRVDMLPFPRQLDWLNTKPLQLEDLRGKFVLIDFWTYCCINCLHILPELKKLEHAYPNELVVIGCHSAKFETEKDSKNIADAILRYEIEHPVINDSNHLFWRQIGVQSWPTILLIDPEGKAVWMRSGEIVFEDVDVLLKRALPFYRQNNLIDNAPIRFELLQHVAEITPLRYPGKVLADQAGDRLFISDSNHNRIVVASLDGELQLTIGSGEIGRANGSFAECSFNHPQGMALHGDTLYVADTENHLLRKIDLKKQLVSTIAGRGRQARGDWPTGRARIPGMPWRGVPLRTELNSPWALLVHQDYLYIAMAGPHQIWRMTLTEGAIGPFAGNGREDIVDGPLLPAQPFGLGASSFAQPSGLSTDGTWLFVADSEGSSIRAVPFDFKKPVKTVVGTAELASGRLFRFGDQDGSRRRALLQHPLGVAYHDGYIYVADTYNDKIKRVNAATGATNTVNVGGDDVKAFDEPEGLSYAGGTLYVADTNNHRIRVIDLATNEVQTLTIQGLQPPTDRGPQKPDFRGKKTVVSAAKLKVVDGKVALKLKLELPAGWKINDLASQRYWITELGTADLIPSSAEGVVEVETPTAELSFELSVIGDSGKTRIEVLMPFYYCEKSGNGLCKQGTVKWEMPLLWSSDGDDAAVLPYVVQLFQFKPRL